MPSCGNGLKDEACLLEVFWVRAFPDFVGGEAVPVGWEGLFDGLKVVGRV
jgi:hypothetical protein